PGLMRAFEQGDEATLIAALDAHPAFIHASDHQGRTALHWAATRLWPQLTAWLLDHDANANARTSTGETPMDLVGQDTDATTADQPRLITRVAEMLLGRGSERTARWAIVANDANWLHERHAEGALANQPGLLTHAIRSDRPEMLRLL